jgi:Competence protein J (ComJ)
MVGLDFREGELASDATRVIDVPFEVPPDGVLEIGSISNSSSFELPSGLYQLRFECYARANSQHPRVRLLFNRNSNPHFDVVRADFGLTMGMDLLLTASPA